MLIGYLLYQVIIQIILLLIGDQAAIFDTMATKENCIDVQFVLMALFLLLKRDIFDAIASKSSAPNSHVRRKNGNGENFE